MFLWIKLNQSSIKPHWFHLRSFTGRCLTKEVKLITGCPLYWVLAFMNAETLIASRANFKGCKENSVAGKTQNKEMKVKTKFRGFQVALYHWPAPLSVTIKLAVFSGVVRRLGSKGVSFHGTHTYPSNPWPSEGKFPAPSAQPTLREFTNTQTNFSLLGQRSEEQGSRVWRRVEGTQDI